MSDEEKRVVENGNGHISEARDGANHDETELASTMLQIQSKRFYLDVKENERGRFIKMAEWGMFSPDFEVGAGGRKSRLLMSMPTAAAFRDHLDDFVAHYEKLQSPDSGASSDRIPLKSALLVRATRRYFLDLKANNRGRFLRISQTATRGGGSPRSQIALPAQGMRQLRDALSGLLEKHGQGDVSECVLPEGKHLRADNKVFYFDVDQNHRGVFMRISEVKSGRRSSITIPEGSWRRVREIFNRLDDEMAELHIGGHEEKEERPVSSDGSQQEDKMKN